MNPKERNPYSQSNDSLCERMPEQKQIIIGSNSHKSQKMVISVQPRKMKI